MNTSPVWWNSCQDPGCECFIQFALKLPSYAFFRIGSFTFQSTGQHLKEKQNCWSKAPLPGIQHEFSIRYNSACARAHGEGKRGASHVPRQSPISTAAPEHRRCLGTRNIQNLKRKYHIWGCVTVLRRCRKWKLSLWCLCLQACFSKL